tara:strand:+ start:2263 stop:2799 length:537 start_codon:yes stop_codon:yes gene_type:complete
MIKEYKVNLSEEQEDFIEWVVNKVDFPLYSFFSNNTVGKINPVFGHILRTRIDDENSDEWAPPNSDFTDMFDNIFIDFCKEYDIKCNRILRSAVNFTTHQPSDSEYFIHRDHDFPHKNFLMYLNEWTGGGTRFFDDEKKLIKTVGPQKYKAIVSDGELHTQEYCDPHQIRVVLVVTFN